ncbi:MAG: sugar phosphate isomerase/epimerase [Planctomycetaceae bacterium]|nr:sugar phosphate isomerase/epimerase [Planctomycetaceae bacterium]
MKHCRKTSWSLAFILIGLVWLAGPMPAQAQDEHTHLALPDDSAAEALGWLLGTQTYTFNRFTFFEALDMAHRVGLKYVEAFPGQRISPEIEGTMGAGMTAAQIELVKRKLAETGIKVTAFGVVGLSADEAESRKIFEWCKTMGVQVINTEVDRAAFDTIEKLCKEYKIKVGLHNHPKPSIYWNPDTIVEALEGRSEWLGACADTGHWLRSDLNPVECLKKLDGKIVSMHFKDLNKSGSEAHDVPWGEGVGNVPGIIAEMKRQEFKGPISVEYEHNWLNSLPEVGQCVQNFHRLTTELK